jgi:GT2 family glycosyltransferase
MEVDGKPMTVVEKPICSVCIANYNGRDYVDACIKSVIGQDFSLPVEIIVHDDASTDESVELIRKNYPQVKIIISKENVGFCVSNNRMAEQARGEFLLFLNNDAELFPDALKSLYYQAQEGPSILSLPQYNASTGELIDRGEKFDPFLNPVPNLDEKVTEVGMVMGACLWIPKRLWDELGGFPEWFGSIAEDMYLCMKAHLKGYPVRVINHSGYRHWVGASFGGGKILKGQLVTTTRRRSLSERNKTFVMITCLPFPYFQIIFPLHILLLLAEGITISILKRDIFIIKNIYISTLLALWRERKKLRFDRHQNQNNAQINLKLFLSMFTLIPYKFKMIKKYGLPQIYTN